MYQVKEFNLSRFNGISDKNAGDAFQALRRLCQGNQPAYGGDRRDLERWSG